MIGLDGRPAPISLYKKKAGTAASRATFVAAHPEPVLVFEPFFAPDETGFATISGIDKGVACEELVGVIKKRPGANAFSHMITLGRASNNDLVVRYQNVSKFHAYLSLGYDGALAGLVDAGSTNGTFIRDVQVASRANALPLDSGVELRFSDLKAVYLEPASFYQYLTESVITDGLSSGRPGM